MRPTRRVLEHRTLLAVAATALAMFAPTASAAVELRGWTGTIQQRLTRSDAATSDTLVIVYRLDGRLHQPPTADATSAFWSQPASWTVTYANRQTFTCLPPAPDPPVSATSSTTANGSGTTGIADIYLNVATGTNSGVARSGYGSTGAYLGAPASVPVAYTDTCPYLDVAHGPTFPVDQAGASLHGQAGLALDQTTLSGKTIFRDAEYTIIQAWTLTREPDRDNDGVPDADDNCLRGYNPDQVDANADGIGDACDAIDSDGDGLTDTREEQLGTDADDADSDDDGLSDGAEVDVHHTDPRRLDSDGDGVDDGDEVNRWGTDPTNADSDGDGWSDGAETAVGTDPGDPTKRPTDRRPQPASCAPTDATGQNLIAIGNAVATGCFHESRPGSGIWHTDGPAQIGGIDVVPGRGERLTLDTARKRVIAPPSVWIRIGRTPLPFPASRLPVAATGIKTELKGSARTLLNGLLPISAAPAIEIAWEAGGQGAVFKTGFDASRLPVDPARYGVDAGGGTAELHLRNGIGVANGTLSLRRLSIVPGEDRALAGAGSFELSNVSGNVQYTQDGYLWTADATIKVEAKAGTVTVGGTLRWLERAGLVGFGGRLATDTKSGVGRLGLKGGSLDFISRPGFGLTGNVEAGIAFGRSGSKPIDIGVNGRLGGGRFVLKHCADPLGGSAFEGLFDAGGKVDIPGAYRFSGSLGLDVCSYFRAAYSRITTKGTLTFVHDDDPGDAIATLTQQLDGYIFDPTSGNMQLSGTGRLQLPLSPDFDARVSWSEFALAACGRVGWLEAGFVWYWVADQFERFTACDLSPYRSTGIVPVARRAPSAPRAATSGHTLPAGLAHAAFRVQGVTDAPAVTIDGPGRHIVVAAGPDALIRTADYVAHRSAATSTTTVFVRAPAAGTWSVGIDDRLAGVATVAVAQAVPAPRITARVTRTAGRRRLAYRLALAKGQSVRFVDRTGDAVRVLGTTAKAKGSFALPALAGRSRSHRIEATVIQDGRPRSTTTVARFTAAPASVGPGRVSGLSARRSGARLAIRWRAAKRATRYFVVVRAGRTVLYSGTTTRRALTVPGIPRSAITVSVRGRDRAGLHGPAARRIVPRR